jgi:uncharacterized protein DUF202
VSSPPDAGRRPAVAPVNLPPGASRERTRLSWRRTALSATIVALLFARLAAAAGRVGLAALALPSLLLVLAMSRRRSRANGPIGSPGPEIRLLAVAVAGYALFGMALVVLPW